MKLPLFTLGALLALAPAALAQPASAFRTVSVTKEYTNGPRAGTKSVLTISTNGVVNYTIRDAAGEARGAINQATPDQLLAVRRAFRNARVTTLPASIFDPSELMTVGSVCLESVLPNGARKTTRAQLELYAGYRDRVRPLVDALDVLEARLEPQVRAGFRSIKLTTRMTSGPDAGRVSVLNLGASSRATFELKTPAGSIIPIAANASRAELERVISAFATAGEVRAIPDGFIFDPSELATFGEIELEIVLASGKKRTIKALLGLYGGHDLRDLVDALGAIEHRFEGASIGVIGVLGSPPGN
jgi:hypothetical protein